MLGGERGIDHVGVAVPDLQRARQTYQDKLGFDRPVAGKLPNGLQNINFYFEDATYLETLNFWDAKKAAWVADFVKRYTHGGVFVVLSIRSIAATSRFLEGRGFKLLAPFKGSIDVDGKKKASSWRTLFFKKSPLPGNQLYFIEYPRETRENFLKRLQSKETRRKFFRHRNTAIGIKAVWMAVRDLEAATKAYESIGLRRGRPFKYPRLKASGQMISAGEGHILLLAPDTKASPLTPFVEGRGPGVLGMSVQVKSLVAARRLISVGTKTKIESFNGPLGVSFLLPPKLTHGIWLEFFQGRPPKP